MAIWTEYVCICTEACGTWLSTNNPDNIDFATKTEGTDYIILKVIDENEVEAPDVNVKKLPGRNTMSLGFGKVDLTLNLNCYVTRSSTVSDKTKYNLIKKFMRLHDESSDTPVYLVMRIANPVSGWDYDEFEDNQDNLDRKYLKGKVSGLNKKKKTYGTIEYTLQFTEAWIP